MVVNSVRSAPANRPGDQPIDSGSIDRQYSFIRPYPFFYEMYNPGYNPYLPYSPQHPGAAGRPLYSLYPAADMSQGYSSKFGLPTGSGYGGASTGHDSSYEIHHHHPAPIHPRPPPFHIPRPKAKKGKGAALSALTLLAFLYFLNMLQNCLKEHMDTMNPTVMVMTAGATRRKDIEDVSLLKPDGMVGGYNAANRHEAIDERFPTFSTESGGNRTQAGSSYWRLLNTREHKLRKSVAEGKQTSGSSNDETVYFDD
ncbi:uncharacterized protein LOC131437052 [Malaya genurostris]|uniref:uncharacterized protein LOC131437052 n=1 Tax=Malaya genurostris TaxID=325434 RepID=UPI0026F39626|nr:uncharacterized protein LOC131437052 [Malaya genurostris]